MAKLSVRQQAILEFIRRYHDDHGFYPAVRDIQKACAISSTSVVDYNLRILQREGYIRRTPEISRGMDLTDRPARGAPVTVVPVLGYVAAGTPAPVPTEESWRQEALETIPLPPELAPRNARDLYALRVRGLSMVDALIDDGDLVVLRPVTEVQDGDMVVAWLKLEQETTLKRLYRQGDRVRLQPANAQMEPIIVPAENVEVHGKVVTVIRRLG